MYDTRLADYKRNPRTIMPMKSIIEQKAELDFKLFISMTDSIAD